MFVLPAGLTVAYMETLREFVEDYVQDYEIMTIFDGLLKLGPTDLEEAFNINKAGHVDIVYNVSVTLSSSHACSLVSALLKRKAPTCSTVMLAIALSA